MTATSTSTGIRLTQFAHGGGCACKIPPGELEDMVRGLTGVPSPGLLVGLDDGDDAAAVRVEGGLASLARADFDHWDLPDPPVIRRGGAPRPGRASASW